MRRTSRQPKRRTSRNPIPPPPRDPDRQQLLAWAQRTYAPGTPVLLGDQEWIVGFPPPRTFEAVTVPEGTRGEVVQVKTIKEDDGWVSVWISVRLHDARSYAAGNVDPWVLKDMDELWAELDRQKTSVVSKRLYRNDYTLGRIQPLADNWPTPSPAKRLDRSQRRTSYKMRNNPAPPPPVSWMDLPAWIKRTYADGTSVMLKMPVSAVSSYGTVDLPAGTKGRVVYVGDNVDDELGHRHYRMDDVTMTVAPYPSYTIPGDAWFAVRWSEAHDVLEPIDDHWGSTKPLKRLHLPTSQKRRYKGTVGHDPQPNARRTSASREVQDLIDAALAAGWRAEPTSGNHMMLYPPDRTKPPVLVGLSKSQDPRAWRNLKALFRKSGLAVNSANDSDSLAEEFARTINMTASEISRWHQDPRSKLASLPHIRRELPLLAEMKKTPASRWTPRMWDKAMRAVNFVKRHEAQMKAQGKRFGSGRMHVTPKRVIALMNWGRKTPGASLSKTIG